MNLDDYRRTLFQTLGEHPLVVRIELDIRPAPPGDTYLRGRLQLVRGFQLDVAEYVREQPSLQRLKYRYHLQDSDRRLSRRWDNAPHYPDLPSFPHHCHLPDGTVIPSPPMDLPAVLQAVGPLLA